MGRNTQSSKYEQLYRSINKVATKVSTSVHNSQSHTNIAYAGVDVRMQNSWVICPGGVNVSSTAKITAKNLSENQTKLKAEMKTEILSLLTTEIEKQQDAENEFLSVGSNTQNDETRIITDLKNDISASIETTISNTFDTYNRADGATVVTVVDTILYGSSCKFDAKAMIESLTHNITSNIMDLLVANGIVQEQDLKAKVTQSAKNSGLDLGFLLMGALVVLAVVLLMSGALSNENLVILLVIGAVVIWFVVF